MPKYRIEMTTTMVVTAPNKLVAMKAARSAEGDEMSWRGIGEEELKVKPMARLRFRFAAAKEKQS